MYADRREAGRMLAQALLVHAGTNPVVLALPRGGVPIAAEVALMLEATLDIWIVRRLPGHIGAIADGPALALEGGARTNLATARSALLELAHRIAKLRGDRPRPEMRGRTVILVDDGIASGASMRAAIRGVKKQHPARVIVAVPVAARETLARVRREVDDVVCLREPDAVSDVGVWYENFAPIRDDVVVRMLAATRPPSV